MVKKMNKSEFIEELEKKTGFDKEYCIKINDALEENFLIGKKNKQKIIASLIEKLNIDEEKANEIYNIASSIIATSIKDKIKHPFKGND